MDSEPKFREGDVVHTVSDIHGVQRNGGPLRSWRVTNPCDPTEMKRVGTGEPVHFYVRLDEFPLNSKRQPLRNQGYHQQNLVLTSEYDKSKYYRGV